MKITLGPMQKSSQFECAELLLNGEKIGSVHQCGYAPKWAFEINKFRWQQMSIEAVRNSSPFDPDGLARLLFDGAAFDSADAAKTAVETQLGAFFDALGKTQNESH